MAGIREGEIGTILLGGDARRVKGNVAGGPRKPQGSWECIDAATGLRFLARVAWYVWTRVRRDEIGTCAEACCEQDK